MTGGFGEEQMRIHNLYTDAKGESHFRDIEVEWVEERRGSLSAQLAATTDEETRGRLRKRRQQHPLRRPAQHLPAGKVLHRPQHGRAQRSHLPVTACDRPTATAP